MILAEIILILNGPLYRKEKDQNIEVKLNKESRV